MREITVISGKGGAGKTTITGALTSLLNKPVITDCDVDAADLYLLLQPEVQETHTFPGGAKAIINQQLCVNCRKCINHCRFDALHYNEDGVLAVNDYKCEGCGLCKNICPANAIEMVQEFSNRWYVSITRYGSMIHAHMKPGEENSGKLVTKLRDAARKKADENQASFIINDGPPGIGCAAIASVTGTDMVVMVIEASKSGFHDFKRAQTLVDSFKTPIVAVINKHDINKTLTAEIEKYLGELNIPLLAKIPFDKNLVDATTQALTYPEYQPDDAITESLKNIVTYLQKPENYEKKQAQSAS